MAKGDAYTLGYAAIICVVCSLLLSTTASLLKPRQDIEVELDRKLNVLKAFGVATEDERGKKMDGAEVDRRFAEHISEIILDGETGQAIPGLTGRELSREDLEQKRKLPLYLWKEDGRITRYAFPISGKGLWSTIYGYMALDADLSTIIGVTFYRHGETPGLGGEIATEAFQKQFVGKRVFKDGRLQRIEVVKGTVADRYPEGNDHAVDGISGATLTGKGLNQFMNRDLEAYEKYFAGIRGGG
ncbi:MAG: NADH:ubiquinone reductase (Na(+)-transporting) subunit C [Verrucomicrobia bacterium]|nr:NADH:ubiquinone reductase (Na(+)-transporting) subunit C [Verrucomicrobiota bacterium]